MNRLVMLLVPGLLLSAVGCTHNRSQMSYETARPMPVVADDDFDRLWSASLDALRDAGFDVARQDRRSGVIVSRPLVGAQAFEPWRQDLKTPDAIAESTLATVRRTVTITIGREGDRFTADADVQVERFARAERRISNAALYTSAFRRTPARGTRETDRGLDLPGEYWYPVAADEALAQSLLINILATLP